ncbi:MAG: hypothetical protein C0519_04605 [Hyphomicrobium sp.]|nr:hypothetical protein [Hyphomicrobium sp.]
MNDTTKSMALRGFKKTPPCYHCGSGWTHFSGIDYRAQLQRIQCRDCGRISFGPLVRYYVELDALLDDVMREAVAITQSLGHVGLFRLALPAANASPEKLQSRFMGTLTIELYEMLLGERDTISVEDALLRTADAVNRYFDLFRNGRDRVRGSDRKQSAVDQIAAKSSLTSSAVLLAYRASKHVSQLDLRPRITIDRIAAISGEGALGK